MKFIKDNVNTQKGGNNVIDLDYVLNNQYNEFLIFAKKNYFDENVEGWNLANKCLGDKKFLIPFNAVYTTTGILNISVKLPASHKHIPKIIDELKENMKSQLNNYLNSKK